MLDNNHRIHVQEHVYEISEMKRLTGPFLARFHHCQFISVVLHMISDELSEKHAHEMRSLLRRVQVKDIFFFFLRSKQQHRTLFSSRF